MKLEIFLLNAYVLEITKCVPKQFQRETNMHYVFPESGVKLKQRKIAPKVECTIVPFHLSYLFRLIRSEAIRNIRN